MGWQLLGFFSSPGDAGMSSVKMKRFLFVSRIVSPWVLEWDSTGEGGRRGDSNPKEPATLSKLVHFGMLPHIGPNTSSLKTGNPEYYFK